LPEKYWKKYISAVYMPPDGDNVFIDPVYDDTAKTMAIKLDGGKRPVADMKRKPRGKGNQGGTAAPGGENKGVDFEAGACVVIETGGEPLEVPASKLMELPYYEQGQSGCCWAASTLMFIMSYLDGPYSDTSIYEILKGMKLGKDEGIGGAWSSDMTRLGARIKGYTGKKTETVTFYNFNNFIKYVIAQVASDKPVMANMGLHQGLFLGYEITDDGKKTMIYHDPQNSREKTPAQTPYRKVSDAQIQSDFTPSFAKSINITISAKEPIDPKKIRLQTFHMPDSQDGNILMKSSGGVGTIKKVGKRRLVADFITWDAFSENGYKFKAWQEQPEFDEFVISAMPVWNSDRKNDAQCVIRSSIHRIRGGIIEYPALLETGEVKITLKRYEDGSVPDQTGNHPSRYLYSNAFEINKMKSKLDAADLEFAVVNELRDAKNNLIGLFNIKFKYRPLIITPGFAKGTAPGGNIQFKASIGENPVNCEWSVSDNDNASIDATGLFKLSETPKQDIAPKISIGAVEKNDNAPQLTIGDTAVKLLKCATAEIEAAPPARIEKLVIKPENAVIGKNDRVSFKAFADNEETTEISWKLTRAPGLLVNTGGITTIESHEEEAVEKSDILGEINKEGVYTPPDLATEYSVQIIATAKACPSITANAKVCISSVKIIEESDPVELEAGNRYRATAAGSYPPENYSFNYDFGDGSPAVNTERDDCDHKYETVGTYTLKVELVDGDKKVFAEDSRKVTVSENKIKVFKEYYESYTGEQTIKSEFEGYEKNDTIHKHGKFKSYSQGGWLKSEGEYREDKKEGKWKYYNGDKTYSEAFFVNDKKQGTWIKYFASGAKHDEYNYVNDICEGPYTEWFEDGKVSIKCSYRNGKREGLYTSWYHDGKKEREGEYRDSNENGVWTFWRKDGSVSEKSLYENGNRKEILNTY
ncbi:MAG TPA: PKD domain-containing protein, partial [Candidatus Wallbacteria bacterium]|nr:PKD domain-containing protein [Candidatus Wallbacteria bacterium]